MSKLCPKCHQTLSTDVELPSVLICSCPNCDYLEAKLLLHNIEFSLGTRLEGISIDVFKPSDFDNAAEGVKPGGETIRFVLPSHSFFVPYDSPPSGILNSIGTSVLPSVVPLPKLTSPKTD